MVTFMSRLLLKYGSIEPYFTSLVLLRLLFSSLRSLV